MLRSRLARAILALWVFAFVAGAAYAAGSGLMDTAKVAQNDR
jgi:hypothetical protein